MLRQDLAIAFAPADAAAAAVERKNLERVGLRVECVLHEIDGVVRLHEEVHVLEGLPRKERLHMVLRPAAWVLQGGRGGAWHSILRRPRPSDQANEGLRKAHQEKRTDKVCRLARLGVRGARTPPRGVLPENLSGWYSRIVSLGGESSCFLR